MESIVNTIIETINSQTANELKNLNQLQRDVELNFLKEMLESIINGTMTDPADVKKRLDTYLKQQLWYVLRLRVSNEIACWNKLRIMLINPTETVDGEVEMVLKSRVEINKIQYLVKWKNLGNEYNSWVDEHEIDKFLIDEYNLIMTMRE